MNRTHTPFPISAPFIALACGAEEMPVRVPEATGAAGSTGDGPRPGADSTPAESMVVRNDASTAQREDSCPPTVTFYRS